MAPIKQQLFQKAVFSTQNHLPLFYNSESKLLPEMEWALYLTLF